MRILRLFIYAIILVTILSLGWLLKISSKTQKPQVPNYTITIKEAFDSVRKDLDSNWKLINISNTLGYSHDFIRQFKDSLIDLQTESIQRNYKSRIFVFSFLNIYDTVKYEGMIFFPVQIAVYGNNVNTKIYFNDCIESDINTITDSICISGFDNACFELFNKTAFNYDIITFNTTFIDNKFYWEFKLTDVIKGEAHIIRINKEGKIDNNAKENSKEDIVKGTPNMII